MREPGSPPGSRIPLGSILRPCLGEFKRPSDRLDPHPSYKPTQEELERREPWYRFHLAVHLIGGVLMFEWVSCLWAYRSTDSALWTVMAGVAAALFMAALALGVRKLEGKRAAKGADLRVGYQTRPTTPDQVDRTSD